MSVQTKAAIVYVVGLVLMFGLAGLLADMHLGQGAGWITFCILGVGFLMPFCIGLYMLRHWGGRLE